MHSERDVYLRLRARQRNWLRCAHRERAYYNARILWGLALRAYLQASRLSAGSRVLASQRLRQAIRLGAISRHRNRCRTSGRARQVLRVAQLARVHLRSAMSEGRLTHFRHGRRTG